MTKRICNNKLYKNEVKPRMKYFYEHPEEFVTIFDIFDESYSIAWSCAIMRCLMHEMSNLVSCYRDDGHPGYMYVKDAHYINEKTKKEYDKIEAYRQVRECNQTILVTNVQGEIVAKIFKPHP